jgi:hypothetical protein
MRVIGIDIALYRTANVLAASYPQAMADYASRDVYRTA